MLLLILPALAELPAEARFLADDTLAVGVAGDGSLINPDLGLGLLADPDGPDGVYPVGGDRLYVGNLFAPWAVGLDDGTAWTMDAAYSGADGLALTWDDLFVGDALQRLQGRGGDGTLDVVVTVLLRDGDPGFFWVLDLTPSTPLSGVSFAAMLDDDVDYAATGDYASVNEGGLGYAVASGAADGRGLALAISGGVGHVCSWCTTPAGLAAGTSASTGDDQIGVVAPLGDLDAGTTTRVVVGYGLGVSADDAVSAAELLAATDDLDGDGAVSADDCDDLDDTVHPGAAELPDGVDDDCDGTVDAGGAWIDDDGDGYAEADGDCDDAAPEVHPGALPVDGVGDADCDGVPDAPWSPDTPDAQVGSNTEPDNGCATAPPTPFGVFGLLGLLTRRRRPSRDAADVAPASVATGSRS